MEGVEYMLNLIKKIILNLPRSEKFNFAFTVFYKLRTVGFKY